MANKRSLQNLIELGTENLHFLNNSLTAFDKGQFFEVKRIASIIRTLIHDTNKSHSIIKQIENHPDNQFHEPMMFFDKPAIPQSLQDGIVAHFDCNLPRIRINITSEAFIDIFRLFKDRNHWWNRMVLATPGTKQRIWSRRELTLKYANKEGGSHVDPLIPTDFLAAQNSMKIVGDNIELGIGYLVMFEAGVSMIQSFHNYLEKVKKASF